MRSIGTNQERVKVKNTTLLSDDWFVLKKHLFEYQRADGSWQEQTRETYDRGNGATILPYNRFRKTVVLVKQFRLAAYVNGHDGFLIESCAGLLDSDDPDTAIRRELAEEAGLEVKSIEKIYDCFMSPGSVTERLHFYIGEYENQSVATAGGVDGEDIEVIELPFEEALNMVKCGEIMDAKTIMLLQYLQLNVFAAADLLQ